MELEIDAKQLLRQALAEVQPGEDIDEAILRVCKKRYPDNYSEIFPEVFRMVDMLAENMDGSRLEIVRELAASEGSMSMTLHSTEVTETRTLTGEPGKLLDKLPPETRAKIARALASDGGSFRTDIEETRSSDKGVKKIERRVSRKTTSGSRKFFDCKCGFLGLGEFDVCPKCGRKAK